MCTSEAIKLNKKRTYIIGLIAGIIVILGIALALFLSPVFSFLTGGSGEEFRNAGTCSARKTSDEAEPSPSDSVSIVIVNDTPEPTDTETPVIDNTSSPDPTPESTFTPHPVIAESTPLPYDQLYSMADTSMMKDIVNILLIGVDFAEERLTWNGKKEWHSDVMMVLSVNFDEKRADLISLPRDTYAKIPGVKGIYKLNAAINCGGGLYKSDGSVNEAGLKKVCEAAEWMLGGIPVDYYYAVTMTSLKSLVDAFGGLDYDLDISFKIQGRSYVKGPQHMNGQAVLDYCRVRKAGNGLSSADIGDANRVNRQKKILVAFFEHMKKNNLIVRIPDVIKAFQGELFTNCTPAQTAALAAFAYNLDRKDIGLYSMGGTQASLFQWNFVFTDQTNRVDIVKKVYGVTVSKHREYTLNYGRYRWCSMLYDQYIDLCEPLQKYVQKRIDEDNELPEPSKSPDPTDTPSPTETPSNTVRPTEAPTDTPRPTSEPTNAPTNTPAPTTEPTAAPSQPGSDPTEKPTDTPAPTATASQETAAPTDTPTPKPTAEPTAAPTTAPTAQPETIDIPVEIDWNDKSDSDGVRPKEVGIVLKANGSTAAKATIKENSSGKWKTTFKDKDKYENGDAIDYSISLDKDSSSYSSLKNHYKSEIKGSAQKGFVIVLTHEVKPEPDPSDQTDSGNETNPSASRRISFEEKTRQYTEAQRELFESYKTALEELKKTKKTADTEAKKAAKGSSNSLNSVSVTYLSQLAKVQNLAIQVAKSFNYTDIKNFTTPFLPTNTGWKTASPWAVNYGLNRSFNEVRVDFN